VETLDELKSCLDVFQAAGYDEVDTARVYTAGKQEAWTTEAGWKERGLSIATKWYPNDEEGHSPEVLRAKIDLSLKELNTNSVDIYYLHAGKFVSLTISSCRLTLTCEPIADRRIPFQETLQAINEAYKQGKFKVFAISNFAASEVGELQCHLNETDSSSQSSSRSQRFV
jgi:aflatoxin B1 aldehyde reductase